MLFKIGMRNFKTALSVAICIFVLDVVGIKQPFFACMTAVFTMQADVSVSFQAGLNRFMGTMAGAVTGTLLATLCSFLPMDCVILRVLIIPLGAMVIIHFLNLLGWKDTIFVACIVYFALMLKVEQVAVPSYAVSRTFLTGFGAIVALLVNRYVYPPQKSAEPSLDKLVMEERP